MKKSEWRTKAKQLLEDMPAERREMIEAKLAAHLFDSVYWKKAKTIALTVSQRHEWDTRVIIEKAWKEKKNVCVPKCYPKVPEIVFYHLSSYDQLECVYIDLLEPNPDAAKSISKQEIDLIIVPGLLFDLQGYRVGYGGGYYDRFLSDFSNPTLALTSNEQLIDEVPRDAYDIAVDHIITETGLIF
ncbi:5-formyltetrahydrofolate cyclo-ligase [Sediminibacillus halophilus]|uniref:5-formyltetrahydrofolate cyclo-ligase n=1 Tax=Sediminibacillus halophilus TaxID=482461 RepID=A0A1G9YHD0_9BACI|nr:5-formyltetrahydrofolate cyclo-ligase [Sediminibacillus halophilus]SDN07966.1 5-formyltetrahydrofolate cyclo-ligase [Sediminibacillus halophilus]